MRNKLKRTLDLLYRESRVAPTDDLPMLTREIRKIYMLIKIPVWAVGFFVMTTFLMIAYFVI